MNMSRRVFLSYQKGLPRTGYSVFPLLFELTGLFIRLPTAATNEMGCYVSSILEIWRYNRTAVNELSEKEIMGNITISPTTR
jgi:hypothetical protein